MVGISYKDVDNEFNSGEFGEQLKHLPHVFRAEVSIFFSFYFQQATTNLNRVGEMAGGGALISRQHLIDGTGREGEGGTYPAQACFRNIH